MKIKYQFATETVEIEVADDWATLIIDLDRQEYNNDHKETRRHVSYDALDFDGDAMATEDPALTAYTEQDDLREAIQQLTPNQQYIIHAHYFEGRTFTEIARALGVGVSSVTRAAERAKNTLNNFLCPPAKNGLSRGLVVKGNTKPPFGKDESDETQS